MGDLAARSAGYYVSNVYGVSRTSLLLKLHHPERPDIMLMLSTAGLWRSSARIRQIEPNRLLARLRRDLLRLRLEGAEQHGTERVAYLRFAGFGRARTLVGEFFGDGNIVLCGDGMKILALLHSLDVRHRTLAVGLAYEPPPANCLDAFSVTGAALRGALAPGLAADRWLGRALGLPARYVGAALRGAGIRRDADCAGLSGAQLDSAALSVRGMLEAVADGGRHDPALVEPPGGGEPEVHPIDLAAGGERTRVPSFAEGLDRLFTERILRAGREAQSAGSDGRARELLARLDEQGKAAQAVREKARRISDLAAALLGRRGGAPGSPAPSSLGDAAAAAVMKLHGAELALEKGAPVVRVCGESVAVDPGSSLHSAASRLYDAAKRQSGAVPAIERQRRKTQALLEEARGRSRRERDSVTASEVRRRAWYERYRWFFTSDGALAVGGRDASSNSSIIRKHAEAGDRVFHAEVLGSPFFVLKPPDGGAHTEAGLREAAHATACFSRAWRESMHGLNAYWVEPEQVRRSAPSGQYLPRGSFSITGRRNFVRVPALRLAVGVSRAGGEGEGRAVSCGPPDAVKRSSAAYAVIEPSGLAMADAAKKVRAEIAGIDAEAAAGASLDDYMRALPAGRSRVAGSGRGELR